MRKVRDAVVASNIGGTKGAKATLHFIRNITQAFLPHSSTEKQKQLDIIYLSMIASKHNCRLLTNISDNQINGSIVILTTSLSPKQQAQVNGSVIGIK